MTNFILFFLLIAILFCIFVCFIFKFRRISLHDYRVNLKVGDECQYRFDELEEIVKIILIEYGNCYCTVLSSDKEYIISPKWINKHYLYPL